VEVSSELMMMLQCQWGCLVSVVWGFGRVKISFSWLLAEVSGVQ
jgi:hypothetical protein